MTISFFIGIRTVFRTEVSVTHKYSGKTGINQNHPVKTGKYGPPTQMQCFLWAKMRWKWKLVLQIGPVDTHICITFQFYTAQYTFTLRKVRPHWRMLTEIKICEWELIVSVLFGNLLRIIAQKISTQKALRNRSKEVVWEASTHVFLMKGYMWSSIHFSRRLLVVTRNRYLSE